jgi:uncharacterized protein (TIGR00369 family)
LSFDQLLGRAGGFRDLFEGAREAGVNVESEVQKAMSIDGGLFGTIGYEVVKVGKGRAELRFPLSRAVARRGGMVHGGVIMYTLDNVSGIAVMTVNPGVDQLTMELKVNFLEPLKNGPFIARGKVIRAGKTVAVAEGEVKDAKGRVCAKSLGTWYLIGKKQGT